MSSNSGNSLNKFEIGSGNWTLILIAGTCSYVAISDRIFILGPSNCFPHPSVTMQIWHPGNFSIPLAVVDSISDSKRVFADVADVINHTPNSRFSAFSVDGNWIRLVSHLSVCPDSL